MKCLSYIDDLNLSHHITKKIGYLLSRYLQVAKKVSSANMFQFITATSIVTEEIWQVPSDGYGDTWCWIRQIRVG